MSIGVSGISSTLSENRLRRRRTISQDQRHICLRYCTNYIISACLCLCIPGKNGTPRDTDFGSVVSTALKSWPPPSPSIPPHLASALSCKASSPLHSAIHTIQATVHLQLARAAPSDTAVDTVMLLYWPFDRQRNNMIKVARRQSCCGDPGEPGC